MCAQSLASPADILSEHAFKTKTSIDFNVLSHNPMQTLIFDDSLVTTCCYPGLNLPTAPIASIPVHVPPRQQVAGRTARIPRSADKQPEAETNKSSTSNSGVRKKSNQQKYFLDVFNQKPFRLTVRVKVPIQEHPKFNFVGKLLGPKGNSLKRLQEKTQTRMAVFGRGSMKTRLQEMKLLESGDPKYKHLEDDLHVEISTYGPPVEVYQRIANALSEIRQYLVPDKNDDIRQQQRLEQTQLMDSKDIC